VKKLKLNKETITVLTEKGQKSIVGGQNTDAPTCKATCKATCERSCGMKMCPKPSGDG